MKLFTKATRALDLHQSKKFPHDQYHPGPHLEYRFANEYPSFRITHSHQQH